MLEDLAPQGFLPLVEVVLGGESLSIAHAHIAESLGAELLKSCVKFLAHLVKLLVAGVGEAERAELHACKGLLLLFLEQSLEPLVKGTSVVTRISLVVCGNADDYKWLLGKLLLLEVEEVDNLRGIKVHYLCLFVQHAGKLLSGTGLATPVDLDWWKIRRCHKLF